MSCVCVKWCRLPVIVERARRRSGVTCRAATLELAPIPSRACVGRALCLVCDWLW